MNILQKQFRNPKKFIFATIPGSVPVAGFIAPTDDTDVYPAIDPIWGIDGHRSVASIAQRDAITVERRRQGMTVFVQADQKVYQLKAGITNGDWVEFASGGSSDTQIKEDFIVDTTIAANGYIDLSNTPLSSRHMFVEKNGALLSEGVGNDFTLSGQRVTFLDNLYISPFPDQISVRYSY